MACDAQDVSGRDLDHAWKWEGREGRCPDIKTVLVQDFKHDDFNTVIGRTADRFEESTDCVVY